MNLTTFLAEPAAPVKEPPTKTEPKEKPKTPATPFTPSPDPKPSRSPSPVPDENYPTCRAEITKSGLIIPEGWDY